jgi:hypothetical protein
MRQRRRRNSIRPPDEVVERMLERAGNRAGVRVGACRSARPSGLLYGRRAALKGCATRNFATHSKIAAGRTTCRARTVRERSCTSADGGRLTGERAQGFANTAARRLDPGEARPVCRTPPRCGQCTPAAASRHVSRRRQAVATRSRRRRRDVGPSCRRDCRARRAPGRRRRVRSGRTRHGRAAARARHGLASATAGPSSARPQSLIAGTRLDPPKALQYE